MMAQTPPKPAPPVPQPTVTLSTEAPPTAVLPALAPDTVIITVGETKITAAQFAAMVDGLPEQFRNAARGPSRKQFGDNLARIIIMSEEGKRRQLDQTEAFKTQAMFQTANVLAGMVYEQLSKSVKLDEEDVRKYYEAHKNEFELVHARQILVRMQGSPVALTPGQKDLSEAEALAKAQELRKKLLGGYDFATLAKEESDDVTSKAQGGDVGTFHRGQKLPSFEEAAFALKPGELSEPVKTPFGYDLIRVETHESKTFEQVRPELESRMRPEATQKALNELLAKSPVILNPDFFGGAKQ